MKWAAPSASRPFSSSAPKAPSSCAAASPTTGLSSREAIRAVQEAGGEVIAEAALVDRSGGSVDLGVPFYPLIAINFPTYAEDELPPELAATPAVKPGSRANP